jgi:hypothetical protein
MLSNYLMLIALSSFVLLSVCYGIQWLVKEEILGLQILGYIFLGLALISALFGIVEKEIALQSSSSNYYYDMLEQKTFIEKQMKAHKEEIEVLHSGEVDGVVFESKNEMVNLNNTIKRYNHIILKHQEYKDNYWHSERYNEAVAKLNLFEEIF